MDGCKSGRSFKDFGIDLNDAHKATTTPSLRCAGIFGPHPAGPRSGVQDHLLGFIGSALVRPACSKRHAPVRALRSLSGYDPPVRFIDPAPGRPATSTLSHRCAGFYGPQSAGPRSGVQVTSSGSSAPLRPGPPASSNDLSQGSTPRPRGRPAQSGSSAPHRVGLPSLLSAAPGSTVLNRPAPLGSLGYVLGFIGPALGPARLLKQLALVRVLRPPLQGDGPASTLFRFIDPAPGRPNCSRTPLGFIGPHQGSARCELRIPGHRAHQRARPAR